jgi:phage prohead protease, HK97 family
MGRTQIQTRSRESEFSTREESGELYIEGYFAVFNSNYELWKGATESIAQGAFANTLGDDIRALIDHETRLVLGRNKAGTLELREDSHGLWGKVRINQNDTDAMNLYERVRRGDVDQCSFGFDITEEETDFREDGTIHWTIKGVKLHEVTVCTFPAYVETNVSARRQDFEQILRRKNEAWRISMRTKLKGDRNNGIKSIDVAEKN